MLASKSPLIEGVRDYFQFLLAELEYYWTSKLQTVIKLLSARERMCLVRTCNTSSSYLDISSASSSGYSLRVLRSLRQIYFCTPPSDHI